LPNFNPLFGKPGRLPVSADEQVDPKVHQPRVGVHKGIQKPPVKFYPIPGHLCHPFLRVSLRPTVGAGLSNSHQFPTHVLQPLTPPLRTLPTDAMLARSLITATQEREVKQVLGGAVAGVAGHSSFPSARESAAWKSE